MVHEDWEWLGDLIGRMAMLNPKREALVDLDSGIPYTYRDLNERANRLANYLAEQLGIEKGDRIAFLSRNRVEMFDAFFACGKLGAIFVPYNIRLTPGELAKLMENEEPKILFYEDFFDPLVQELRESLPRLKHYAVLAETSVDGNLAYTEIMNYPNTKPRRCQGLKLEDIYLLVHTGGTTGLPKGAMISHRAVLYNQLNNILDWELDSDKTFHLLLPLFHTGGWNLLTLGMLAIGGRVLINRSFDPGLALRVVAEYKPNYVFGAATIFRMIADQAEFDITDWSSVEWVMSGAASTPVQLMEKFWDKGIKMCLGYGLTEGGPTNLCAPVKFMNFEQLKLKHASVGKPFYFTVAKIVNEEGDEVGAGEAGELIFSGPQIFSGYWRNEQETKKTLKNGWVYTGDMAQKDEDGFYYIVGRKKNMFISGGENVFPPEIETILYEIPEVHECCVIGVPDSKWGEVGKAIIAPKPGMSISKEQVVNFLKTKLAPYKVPRYVAFVPEVPKNSVGKIVAQEAVRLYGQPRDEGLLP
ncbi:class I adenylate-forming enzyme family protein [Paradesulfitobacterium ferrireducens]|uniref:class I adenylate-forming enzyme family protein n=1 Tax=Paradesulfitobacterium ferrireducens TaxID=2816476 RepID=UPI001A8E209B|nr:AMP-binding protein [Paradesulfitobacterium ferrireducens]